MDQRFAAPAKQATRARDLTYDGRGAWTTAGGYRRIIAGTSNPFAASGAIESIHFFSQHNGSRRWLVYIDGSGNLYTFNPSTAARSGSPGDAAKDRTGTTITRAVVTSPWQRSQSACWGDHFYLINGINRPLVFNGYWWDYAGFSGPAGSPSATAMDYPLAVDSGGGGTDDVWHIPNTGLGPTSEDSTTDYICAYRYRVSFVNSRGQESPLSQPSDLVTFENKGGLTSQGQGRHFARISLPIGASEVVARRLYRTQNINDSNGDPVSGRGEVFYFHSEIQDNVTSLYQDSLPDGFLGSKVDDLNYGAWPLSAKFIAPFKGRLFLTGAGNSKVYFSRPGYPEMFPPENELDVGDANLGPITGMYATRNALVVFKARAIYLVKDAGNGVFQAQTLTREVGCSSPNTIREVPDLGLCFLAGESIGLLQGALEQDGTPTKVLNLAIPLPYTMRRLNRSALINACSAVHHKDKEWWLCVPTLGKADNNLVLVYHHEIGEWTYREKYPIASILETPDHRGHLYFGSYAESTSRAPDGVVNLGIMVYSRGWQYKGASTAIEPMYQTGEFTASPFRPMRPKGLILQSVLHGNNDLTVQVYSNRSATGWFTAAMTQDQQYIFDPLPVYGTAVFDGATTLYWQDARVGPQRFDFENVDAGPVTDCTVVFSPASGTRLMSLVAMTLEIASDDPRGKPMSAAS